MPEAKLAPKTFESVLERNADRLRWVIARIPFDTAMLEFGSDKPDLRNPIRIADVTEGVSDQAAGECRARKRQQEIAEEVKLFAPGIPQTWQGPQFRRRIGRSNL